MRLFIVCLFLIQSLFIFSQSSTSKYIDSKEKQRLENEFKALGDYYIDDSGLVVYRSNSEVKIREADKNENKSKLTDSNSESIKIYQEAQELGKPEKKSTVVEVIEEDEFPTRIEEYKETYIDDEPQFYYYNRQNQSLDVDDKKIKSTVDSTPAKIEKEEIIVVDKTSKAEDEKIIKAIATNKTKDVSPQSIKTTAGTGESVLNRRRKSQYKNMEEAALAVEALIETLKKEQVAYTNSGSMSSRLSLGVKKDLRKKSGDFNQQINYTYGMEDSQTTSEFDNEPSYFINGVQVNKLEINKLRKIDIINREIRVRNTVTGNPNGEIWYEVKKDAILQP